MTFPLTNGRGAALDLYHTGIVVTDLESAMAEFNELLGVSWRRVCESEVAVVTPNGPEALRLRYVHSLEGPPYLELVESIPGTVWDAHGEGHVHHLGIAVADPPTIASALEAGGMTWIVSDDRGEVAGSTFCYFAAKCGPLIELVAPAARHSAYLDRNRVAWADLSTEEPTAG
jgi:hypothetical protein